jgi:hypothetical protein
MSSNKDCPEDCFQGSTVFYSVTPDTDRYTPSYLEARPFFERCGDEVKDNVRGPRNDGTYPPWVLEGDPNKSSLEQYVEWFNSIWVNGDPSSWNASCFTNNTVTIDPSGSTTGAEEAALNFIMLFRYFPDLRGEVVSWGANERELFINWRFRIPNTRKDRLPIGPITQTLQEQQGGRDYLVPVIDKFCFVDGRVSFRAAFFDIVTLTAYLSENFAANELYDFLIASTWKALTSGGIPVLPKMLINLFLGLFVWGKVPKVTGLSAVASDQAVTLRWTKVLEAESYKVCRATSIAGPFITLPLGGTAKEQAIKSNIYQDEQVENGKPYWYLVSPNFKKGKPVTLLEGAEIANARLSKF